MNVLVNGIGNIGTTLLNFLCSHRELLGLENIYGLKNSTIHPWIKEDLDFLEQKGVELCSTESGYTEPESVLQKVDYIFDATANGLGLKNKSLYASLPHLKGCSAQGSEKGFGIPFMSGVNNEGIRDEKYTQIVSCNTHAIASLILTLTDGHPEQLTDGDFVVVRRSEDLANHQRLVSANVVSRHRNLDSGTHHAEDVKDLFGAIGTTLHVQSSDVTTPSQLMHTLRFDIQVKDSLPHQEIERRLKTNPLISSTTKFDSNLIFELGRRYGFQGRIFSHAIVNSNNLLLTENRIKGWAFVPQEGNTILSTIHAFLLQTNTANTAELMAVFEEEYLREGW